MYPITYSASTSFSTSPPGDTGALVVDLQLERKDSIPFNPGGLHSVRIGGYNFEIEKSVWNNDTQSFEAYLSMMPLKQHHVESYNTEEAINQLKQGAKEMADLLGFEIVDSKEEWNPAPF